jgi:thioredoxin-related protein
MRSRLVLSFVIAVLVLAGSYDRSQAARDWLPPWLSPNQGAVTAPVSASNMELLVFEVQGCVYCDVFRRDVLPNYQAGPASARAPIRFVDLNSVDADKLALRGSVRVVPTMILMKEGKEVERITGYTAPSTFFKLVNTMLERAD